MKLVEIRDLDGPNIFLLKPAIKIEFQVESSTGVRDALRRISHKLDQLGTDNDESGINFSFDITSGRDLVQAVGEPLLELTMALHRRVHLEEPAAVATELDTPRHIAIAYGWTHRRLALAIAEAVASFALEESEPEPVIANIESIPDSDPQPDDEPEYIRDSERTLPIIGITGTNGKTTTTRLIAHILRSTGLKVGWTSTAGVYIDGELVLQGDYTGPNGARRVLSEPGLDVAALETARGGILLRGLAYESNDVSVFTNISADHLGLHGINTLEGLAMTKSTVVKVTRPGGTVVLNADDPLVRGCAGVIHSSPLFISRSADNPTIQSHIATGGQALWVDDNTMLFAHGTHVETITNLAEIPMTFGGRAAHMVENALCGAGACLGYGLTLEQVRNGLQTFHNSPDHNPGRLNAYDVNGVTVISDYAHNEAGLTHLISLARQFLSESGKLITIVGTAGDRTDEAIRGMGELAGRASDRVIIKDTQRYLRGRQPGEIGEHFAEGIAHANPQLQWEDQPTELDAIRHALDTTNPGDVIAMMSIEQVTEIQSELTARGTLIS